MNIQTKNKPQKNQIARQHGYDRLETMIIAEVNNIEKYPTVADLAAIFNVNSNTIHRWRSLLGVAPDRPLGGLLRGGWRHDVPNGEVLEHLAEGHSITETARYFECNRKLIQRIKTGRRRDLV